MSTEFYDHFLSWVATNAPEVGLLGTETGFSEWMVSPYQITLSEAHERQIKSACALIFESAPSPVGVAKDVFTSVDFYITDDGPKVIEINTNSAGAILVDLLYRFHLGQPSVMIPQVRKMFESVLADSGAASPPSIAIVDESPETQRTRFDFMLVDSLFQSWGWKSAIVDPGQLQWDGYRLHDASGAGIDLVYNRFCDFYLETPIATVLKTAFESNGRLITPNPGNYAALADKSRLIELSKIAELNAVIPPVLHISAMDPDDVWARRKSLFFKPSRSYGSKAVYKGESISKKVFATFWETDYIAQPYFQAGTQPFNGVDYKYDIRAYMFQGNVQMMGARLFQGQVTNFKTVGGGFAPVLIK
jgi:glutathione synthase/RimK-type ligase-like ATP-grasp enzyme